MCAVFLKWNENSFLFSLVWNYTRILPTDFNLVLKAPDVKWSWNVEGAWCGKIWTEGVFREDKSSVWFLWYLIFLMQIEKSPNTAVEEGGAIRQLPLLRNGQKEETERCSLLHAWLYSLWNSASLLKCLTHTHCLSHHFLKKLINLFIFGCPGSLLLCLGFL